MTECHDSFAQDACGHLNPRFRKTDSKCVYGTTCNMSVSIGMLHRLGDSYFDGRFPGASYEDIEFCVRNTMNGVALRYISCAAVRHEFVLPGQDPNTALFERFRRYGASEHILLAAQPTVTTHELYAETFSLVLESA